MDGDKLKLGLLCLAALLLWGCGGGSNLEVVTDYRKLLSGGYQIHQVGDGGSVPYAATAARVDIMSDGVSAGTWSIAEHSGGSAGSGLFVYTVASDRTVSVSTQDATGVVTIGTDHGMVSADGNLVVLSDTKPTPVLGPPAEDAGIVLAAGLKKSSGLTNAVLSGDYQIHQAGDAGASAGLYTSRVDIAITDSVAGAGSWNIAIGNHSEGSVGSGTFTYSVAPDGTFTLTTPTGTDHGIVSAGGGMFLISDANPTASGALEDAEVIMAVGVKKSAGLNSATLKGRYQINQIGDGGLGTTTARVDIIADGAGSGTWSIVGHSAGDTGSGTFTYVINPVDGTFSVTTKDATGTTTIGTDYGIISADGSMFVLTDTKPVVSAGPPVEDAEIVMAIGIRK